MNLSGSEEITSYRLILRPDERCSSLEDLTPEQIQIGN